MASGVETPQISIDPYRSQVPLVQIPQQDLQGPPQQGGIYSKAGGIATIADGAMKGLLRGLQLKEQKKYETATAVMNAQDAAIGDAKKQYQDALITKGKDDPETQAKWNAYTDVVNKSAEARQAFAVPEKTPKQGKGQKKSKTAADGAPAAGGFAAGLKQFFEQNPHIVPELAIIGMKSQVDPKLYGQMTPEMTQQKQQYDAAQRQEANQKVTDAARATYGKYAGRENLTPQERSDLANATAVLTPIQRPTNTMRAYSSPDGSQREWYYPGMEPGGWNAMANPGATGQPKVGSAEEITANYLRQHNIKPEDASPQLLKYLRDYANYKAVQNTTSTATSTTDKDGNRTNVNQTTRGAAEPKPPAGFAPVGEDGQPLKEVKTGKITAPPSDPSAPAGGKGRMTAPPSADGKQTLTQANRVEKYQDWVKKQYDDAAKAYETAREKNDPQAKANYEAAKAQIVLAMASKIKATGGDPWKKNSQGVQFVQFPGDDGVYGTMDGVNWVNIKTGYPSGGG